MARITNYKDCECIYRNAHYGLHINDDKFMFIVDYESINTEVRLVEFTTVANFCWIGSVKDSFRGKEAPGGIDYTAEFFHFCIECIDAIKKYKKERGYE
jgi:hypothetical protein